MRTPDPIADNQTDQTIIALTNGNADNATRDHATAALLASVQKLILKVDDIDRNLWKPSDLEKVIDDRHKLVCQACPVRKFAEVYMSSDSKRKLPQTPGDPQPEQPEEPQSRFSGFLALLGRNPLSIGLVVICLGLLAAVIILATGREGFREITDAAHITSGKKETTSYPAYPADPDWWKNDSPCRHGKEDRK